ncbi:ABC transporter substrate-binding protein [Microbacterium azadirachtae]|uniref:Spermidine/putrescine-binding periplasmic protein n=1 Tax=Microbacterium azadirachtae TaxID=582680 RepID=A0A0F0KXB7_9MICO|nr:ABC transporter substrate-binding protein [Microbacterium azadirachtae]KJL25548.1 Spermidine/putrescine-binding periplasmic protein precursor [Microbacterium azadirachtae]SDL32774.1 putative spermidine/putrescine transport system substrate-binding protein [Microbacterium azadirachtae]SEF62920.1 putative spermidine/putrescine transport system substrate-binding protein [Microbacterium azadirachtae]SEF63703.1 putative spermidine/putrescine transport system substrate-binding protein [Microbacter
MRKNALPALAALGLTTVVLAALTGCGTAGSSGGGGTGPVDKLGKNEGAVKILAWPGYVEDGSNDPKVDWVSEFTKSTGCKVEAKTFGTSDEALNLMKTGDYDVVSASGDASLRLIASGDVVEVNTKLLKNYDGIFPFLKDRAWNTVDGKHYGVPHGYGANLLMYNTEAFPTAPTSWDVVFDKASDHRGKITAYDSPIYIADAAVYLMAHKPELKITNPYALDQKQFDAAVSLLKEQRPNISEYWGDYLKEVQSFQSGDSVAGTTWQVIQNTLEGEGGKTAVVLPDEGATGWSDTWMISSKAKNPNCAYAWLDYISSPKANAQATAFFGEAPSSEKACDFRDDCASYHAGDAEYAKKIWYWTTPIAKCLDGRTDVKCIDYAGWTTAWQQIRN